MNKFFYKLKIYPKNYNYISILFTYIFVIFFIFAYIIFLKNYITIPTCAIYKYLHIYCPACGSTRATLTLIKFNIIDSLRYNPFIVYILFFSTLYIITETINIINFSNESNLKHSYFNIISNKFKLSWSLIIIIGLILLFANFIIKNSIFLDILN
jgi:hypothetical protein